MKVLAIGGSPRRNGNSNTLAEQFLAVALGRGAETRFVYLNGLSRVHGCQACQACKGRTERCVVEDDLQEVLLAVENADVLVLATPVYFGDISAQLKLCFDRFYAFFTKEFKPRLAHGKQVVMILSQGDGNEKSFADLFSRYETFLKFLGFAAVHQVRLCGGSDPQTAANRPALQAQVTELARALVRW